ncbi:LysR family transcriptional regulator [Qipengyuania gaetbuli]|uniref:LysR family transcriptional regulator n=1 Tax=Qipengyuania gaetbuli TaxID=266952 RepID=UPI00299D12B7|nr:LysR family transcriptional regulator [Qipengyuania gaetbuli]
MADLAAFAVVAEEQSFTRASKRLGMSQSALSQIVRRLEERLGLRLLARTTRSVAPTQVGEQLLSTLTPMLRDLDASIEALSETKEKPAGTIRITSVEHAARQFLIPALAKILPDNPDIKVEIEVDYGLKDIIASHFDAGVRIGEQVEKDMIAVRISPPVPMAIVASPAYFALNPAPSTPRELSRHVCLNLRMPTSGTFYEWRLSKDGKAVHVRLDGQLAFNALGPIRDAALAGLGIANLPLDQVAELLAAGRLQRAMTDWSEDLPPYYLYYPHRRHGSAAFRLVIDALRWRD